jgi:CIC family chloride channel protein
MAQIAITGATWLPQGWLGVELLVVAGLAKIIATSLTVGSGGSAGDFGPSLVMGGVFGGAFGRALQLLLHDPRIDPGAFALVGMGTFYGGIAHVPVSSLVMVCELAGSYDLLVPLMLAEAIAFVALRKRSLYHAQVVSKRDSPAHRGDLDVFNGQTVRDVATLCSVVTFTPATPTRTIVQQLAETPSQVVFPVLDHDGKIAGTITTDLLHTYVQDPEFQAVTVATDLMGPSMSVHIDEDLARAVELMLRYQVRELPVIDDANQIVGLLDEAEIARSYMRSTPDGDTGPTA